MSFAFGSTTWPGTAKVLEEMSELGEILGKIIGTGGKTTHWDGTDLRQRLLEEIADVKAALTFFGQADFTLEERRSIETRAEMKLTLFWKWHLEQEVPEAH